MTAAATTTTPFPSPNSDSIYKAIHPQRRRPQIRRRNRLNAGSSGDNDEGEEGPALSLRQISEGRRVVAAFRLSFDGRGKREGKAIFVQRSQSAVSVGAPLRLAAAATADRLALSLSLLLLRRLRRTPDRRSKFDLPTQRQTDGRAGGGEAGRPAGLEKGETRPTPLAPTEAVRQASQEKRRRRGRH